VWSRNPQHAQDVARRVQTDSVGVNHYMPDPIALFGGVKASGIGRELGPEGLDASFQFSRSMSLRRRPRTPRKSASDRYGRLAQITPASNEVIAEVMAADPAGEVMPERRELVSSLACVCLTETPVRRRRPSFTRWRLSCHGYEPAS
jgi:hypothetical protein